MTPEQKAVVLDAAQEMQTNDEWWLQFDRNVGGEWLACTEQSNPLTWSHLSTRFRRKPKTITVTMPVPFTITEYASSFEALIAFKTKEDRDTALVAIREAMEVGNE